MFSLTKLSEENELNPHHFFVTVQQTPNIAGHVYFAPEIIYSIIIIYGSPLFAKMEDQKEAHAINSI